MRLSHKRKVAAKKAGVIPRTKPLYRWSADRSRNNELSDLSQCNDLPVEFIQLGGVLRLKSGESITFMPARMGMSKPLYDHQARMRVQAKCTAETSLFQNALQRVSKTLKETWANKLSGLFGSRTRSA